MDFFFPRPRRNSLDLTEISVEVVDPTAQPVITTFEKIWGAVSRYFSCHLVDPFTDMKATFKEDHNNYRAFCQLFHVKSFTVFLLSIKALAYFCIIVMAFIYRTGSVLRLSLLTLFGTALSADAFLLLGVMTRDIRNFLPFFFITFLFTATAIVRFFIEFLDIANIRVPISHERVGLLAFHVVVITLEFYSLVIVWRLFNYINDRIMFDELSHLCDGEEHQDIAPEYGRPQQPSEASRPLPSPHFRQIVESETSSDEDENLTPMTRSERLEFRIKWLNQIKIGAIAKLRHGRTRYEI